MDHVTFSRELALYLVHTKHTKLMMFLLCSAGMWSHTMTVQDYQDLIDRGWRRYEAAVGKIHTFSCSIAYGFVFVSIVTEI